MCNFNVDFGWTAYSAYIVDNVGMSKEDVIHSHADYESISGRENN